MVETTRTDSKRSERMLNVARKDVLLLAMI